MSNRNWIREIDTTAQIERQELRLTAKEKAAELANVIREMPIPSNRNPSSRACKACAEWLVKCLNFGWTKDDLDVLENLWWVYHDDAGLFIESADLHEPENRSDQK